MLDNILSWKPAGDVGWRFHLKWNKLVEYRITFKALPYYFAFSFQREANSAWGLGF